MIKTIRTLAEAYGPSGHEDQIRSIIQAEYPVSSVAQFFKWLELTILLGELPTIKLSASSLFDELSSDSKYLLSSCIL